MITSSLPPTKRVNSCVETIVKMIMKILGMNSSIIHDFLWNTSHIDLTQNSSIIHDFHRNTSHINLTQTAVLRMTFLGTHPTLTRHKHMKLAAVLIFISLKTKEEAHFQYLDPTYGKRNRLL